MDRLTENQRVKNMRAVKSKGSKIEVALSKSIWAAGYRYRKNDKTVFGKPDLTFKKYKIAVFADSEFWHGKDWTEKKHDIKSNQEFWIRKIERNIIRDHEVNKKLREDGWEVIRFWGKDIEKNLRNCTQIVIDKINEAKKQ
ncbi:MAG: DNA mismatch endonuclease Vsr [Bacteroidales bacterium]|nr:DNA mismatch endonuclease Vsr [Bacteroidales bacterium]